MYSIKRIIILIVLLIPIGVCSSNFNRFINTDDTTSSKNTFNNSLEQSLNELGTCKPKKLNIYNQNMFLEKNGENSFLHMISISQTTKLSLQKFSNRNYANYNYMAVYNNSTMSYDFYPTNFAINFNIYSPRICTQRLSPIKIDSFNPYGASKPIDMVFLGIANTFLRIIQE